eukprot:snap_masked-scaffold_5-processed-gene-13.41-mRNA-1 protein AED:1.00 eAED:1.00 QI:0/0/0/0/1/1/2/0/83
MLPKSLLVLYSPYTPYSSDKDSANRSYLKGGSSCEVADFSGLPVSAYSYLFTFLGLMREEQREFSFDNTFSHYSLVAPVLNGI